MEETKDVIAVSDQTAADAQLGPEDVCGHVQWVIMNVVTFTRQLES